MFESLGKLVIKNIRTKGGERSLKAAGVLAVCPEALKAVLGEEVGGRIKPLSFRGGLLTLECSRSTDSEDVRWQEQELIEAVNSRLGERGVVRLKLR